MKTLALLLVFISQSAFAATTAEQIQLGFNSNDSGVCGTRPKPCWTPYSNTNPLPISGGGGTGTVTSFSFTNGNGATGVVIGTTTAPALTLSPTAGGTFASSANNLGFFASTTSAQLAGVISNETGSGLLVFGTAPSISGATITTSSVNGITLTTGGSATTYLNGAGSYTTPATATNATLRVVGFTVDGAGSALSTGQKGYYRVPVSGTITGWSIIPDQSCSAVVDVWKVAGGGAGTQTIPTVANTITASALPTISSSVGSYSTTLTGWTTSVSVGDNFGWNLNSVSTCTRLTFELYITTN